MHEVLLTVLQNGQILAGLIGVVQTAPGTLFGLLMWLELRKVTPALAELRTLLIHEPRAAK